MGLTVTAPEGTYAHGTHAKYVMEKCRCEDCRKAARTYEKQHAKLVAYGKSPNVDAEPARQHVLYLMSRGMGYKRIAEQVGLNPKTVYILVAGRSERNTPPPKQIRRETAEKLLSAKLRYSRRQPVDAAVVWEMVADIMALGYSKKWIAEQLGHQAALQLNAKKVRAENYVAIKRLWERTTTPRVCATRNEESAATRARRYSVKLRKKLASSKPVRMVELDTDKVRRVIGDMPIAALSDADQRAIYRALDGRLVKESTAERIASVLGVSLKEVAA